RFRAGNGGHAKVLSQAVVVEVNEGKMFVLLPCQYSRVIFKNHTVMWTRNDLNPKSVHLQREGGDDLREQNQRYSERTSMRPDALDSGDFSLTLRKPTKTDSGKYTCSITDGQEELICNFACFLKRIVFCVLIDSRSLSISSVPCRRNRYIDH
uniref:Ig-like domain-containing protein n=1 Tax=Pundamilia nyererei TaxID=303518 RepID=A0A3B4HC22_9CICH